jgi:hypothetical protein
MALDFQPLQIPLIGGLNTGSDPRALQPPALAVCRDVEFDDVGGLQTRHPFTALSASIFPSGTIANPRRIVANGDELLMFTKESLYSWNAALSKWVSKGTHLAIAIDEDPKFVTTGDQIQCDRAELNGTVVYTWRDQTVYVAAVDKTTGSVLMAPTVMSGGTSRPRVVALTTRILLLLFQADNFLVCYSMDPAAPATALAGASTTVYNAGARAEGRPEIAYDVVKREGANEAFVAVSHYDGLGYTVAQITAAPVVTAVNKARNCGIAIAIASTPSGGNAMVIRADAAEVYADYVVQGTLADVWTATDLGAASSNPVTQIAAAFQSVTNGGYYRCYAFFSAGETPLVSTSFRTKYAWANTNAAASASPTHLAWYVSVASRAFDRNGSVYVNTVFSGAAAGISFGTVGPALQNTYFLFRDDGRLCGKQVATRAAGFDWNVTVFYASTPGHLPGVVLTDTETYAWCAHERRIVPLAAGEDHGYSARSPVDVHITFDTNRARRCVRLGSTLYITGAEIMQYDGSNLTEVGCHVYPWFIGSISLITGALVNGTYTYKTTYRWDNAKGERERSTTAMYADVVVSAGPKGVRLANVCPMDLTHKTDATSPIALEVWRTAVNPGSLDVPFYLETSRDPAATGANGYLKNTTSVSLLTFDDLLADVDAVTHESNDEVGTILENLAPPAASIICNTQDRLFLGGVAGDPDRVWYSKLRNEGWVAAFHDSLTIPIPPAGGDITGLAILSETLVVFREHAIYVIPGDGYGNDGGGSNYGPARVVSVDCGAESHEAIARTDMGLIFKSSKGWYLLTTGWQVQYIGDAVAGFDSDVVVAISVVESKHQVRCLTSSRMLVWDYLVNQWSEWTIAAGVHATMWRGTHAYLSTSTALTESTTYTALTYGMDIETPWIKLNDLQGRGRVRWISLLGEWRSTHKIQVRVARDYETNTDGLGVADWFQDKTWSPANTVAGTVEQMRHGPSIQRCQAIKIRLTVVANDASVVTATYPTGEAVRLTGLGLEVGIERGLQRQLAAASKQ